MKFTWYWAISQVSALVSTCRSIFQGERHQVGNPLTIFTAGCSQCSNGLCSSACVVVLVELPLAFDSVDGNFKPDDGLKQSVDEFGSRVVYRPRLREAGFEVATTTQRAPTTPDRE